MGGKLFLRNTRSIQLTPEGASFLPIAKRLVVDWESAAVDLKHRFSLQQGQLTMAAMPSFSARYLPDLLAIMGQQYPQILVKIHDVTMEVVIEQVLSERAELGVIFEPSHLAGLNFQPILLDDFIVASSPQLELSNNGKVSWKRLETVPVVAMNQGAAIRQWQDEICLNQEITLNVVCHAHQLNTLMQLVKKNIGVGIFPGFCRQLLAQLGLNILSLEKPKLKRDVGIISRSRSGLSQPALKMKEIMANYFSLAKALN